MENLNLNLPPFYPLQKIVALESFLPDIVKGKTYTANTCVQCQNCKAWHVLINELPSTGSGVYDCVYSTGCRQVVLSKSQHRGLRAKWFAPIEERFISFAEVIESESPLIGAN